MEQIKNKIIKGSFLDHSKSLPDEIFDICITDPPYRVISGGKPKAKNQPGGMLKKNDGKIFAHNDISISDWLPEVYRLLKPNAHCYIFTNTINLEEMLRISRETGFQLHNLLIWEKNNSVVNRWYMKNAEYVLFLRKGKAFAIQNVGSKTVHKFDNILGNKTHPTEKPCDLLRFYLENSSVPGDHLLEPFSGSGSMAEACYLSGRFYTAFEIDDEYYENSVERLRNLQGEEDEDD